ncbi:MAG: alkaline phosphatase family protein [Kofleriaceae bacterium]
MSAHAIVIGIDAYTHAEWNLHGAVADAIEFARWATTSGGVAQSDLKLFLGPHGGTPSFATLPPLEWKPASETGLKKALTRYQSEAHKASRLWVFYAGHAVAVPGDGTSGAPAIIPPDIEDTTDLESYVNTDRRISLELFRQMMEDRVPGEQVFFVDACRNVFKSSSTKFIAQSVMHTGPGTAGSKQIVYLSTTAWKKSFETKGRGLFGKTLCSALKGLGPTLEPPEAPGKPMRLFVDGLHGFVSTIVPTLARDAGLGGDHIQVAQPHLHNTIKDVVLATFPKDALPRVPITLLVSPPEAREDGTIEFLHTYDGEEERVCKDPPAIGPGLPEKAIFQVTGGKKRIRVRAPGFVEVIVEPHVHTTKSIPVALTPIVHDEGLESLGTRRTNLAIASLDRQARLAIVNDKDQELAFGTDHVSFLVEDGRYRLTAMLSASERVEKNVTISNGVVFLIERDPRTTDTTDTSDTDDIDAQYTTKEVSLPIQLVLPIRPPTPAVEASLPSDMQYQPGAGIPMAEHFGTVADGRLSTLLASAAWASRWGSRDDEHGFFKLKSIFDRVNFLPVPAGEGGLHVLVGDALLDGEFLDSVKVSLEEHDGVPIDDLALDVLPMMVMVRQRLIPLPPGTCRVRVEILGYARSTYPIHVVPGFITLLLVTREDEDDVDVQQQFHPVDPLQPLGGMFPRPQDVRLIGLSSQALAEGARLTRGEVDDLLRGKWSNPLLAITAGYRMFGTDHEDQFRGPIDDLRRDGDTRGPSPLGNLRRFFPTLPDVHVLAALYDPERRDDHFVAAMLRGVPIVVQGFAALSRWLPQRAGRRDAPPPILREQIVPGSVWTAFTERADNAREHVVLPSGSSVARRDDARVSLAATGRIATSTNEHICSTFLVGQRTAACPTRFALQFARLDGGVWSAPDPVKVQIGERIATVVRVVPTPRPDHGLSPEVAENWPVMLELAEAIDVRVPPIICSRLEVGAAIVGTGVATRDVGIPQPFAAAFVQHEATEQLFSGSITAVSGPTIEVDLFTSSGCEGGAVFDASTGALIAMHVVSSWTGERKRGLAITAGWLAHAMTDELDEGLESVEDDEAVGAPARKTTARNARKVELAPNLWQELQCFVGGKGQIAVSVTAETAQSAIELELARPDGTVVARAKPDRVSGTKYIARDVDLDPSRPWTLRARCVARVTVRMEATFPAQLELVPLAKLNPAVKSVLAEVGLRVSVENNILDVSVDHSLGKHVKSWRHKDVSKELGDTTISGLRTKGISLSFVPSVNATVGGWAMLKIAFEDGAMFSQGVGQSFRTRDASMTISLGIGVSDGRLAASPVGVTFDADVYDRAAFAWIYDIVFGSLRDKVRKKVENELAEQLKGEDLRNLLIDASGWLCNLLRGQLLVDLWVDGTNLAVATMAKPFARPVRPVATVRPQPRWPIEHIAIVMMENRSFTHMLGELMAGPRPDLRIAGTPVPIVDARADARGVTDRLALPFDPPHSKEAHLENMAGRWTTPCIPKHPSAEVREEVLKYHRISRLPVFEMFAQHFCVATQWRSSLPGHTWPNRLYSLSGSSNGHLNNPSGKFDFYDLPTICDVLSAQKVPWAYYKHDVAFLELYRRWTFDNTSIKPFAEFQNACSANTLPAVSWIEPNISDFGIGLGSDDHPPLSPLPGQQFLADVYDSLCKLTTRNWLLVVCYDEHGGFYEEVGPVQTEDDFAACRKTGFRIPAFFVSPRIPARTTYPHALDHTSIIRTLLDAYCQPEPIFERNARVASARSFLDVVPQSTATRITLPATPVVGELDEPEAVTPSRTSPEWGAFKHAKSDREDAQTQPEAISPAAVGVSANLEAIYIVASSIEACVAITQRLEQRGLRVRHAFDDERAVYGEPIGGMPVARAWDLVHELRARRDVIVVDPIWETQIGWPIADSEEAPEAVVNPDWAVTLVRAREAWKLSSPTGVSRGAGIIIGHLDTGYTIHPELEDGTIVVPFGFDFLDDDMDATDPLAQGPLLFPGHGTATASIIASREHGAIVGTAPAATLIPYRISRSVVHISMKNMVAAIRRAVAFGCHVISISAGGLWSAALKRAVRDARDAGVIVVAAAGNYVPFVVWPAQYDEVISCAACNRASTPWRWSSRGRSVDITAPGEDLVVAEANSMTRISSGTSFATAMVSGAISNWLAFHGRDRLVAMYGAHNLTDVARDLLARSARPLQRDPQGMGPGILDMHALLSQPLPPPSDYERFFDEAVASPVVDSLRAADELAESLGILQVDALPLAARQPLADELLFHRALELASAEGVPEAVSPIPPNASSMLAAALARPPV